MTGPEPQPPIWPIQQPSRFRPLPAPGGGSSLSDRQTDHSIPGDQDAPTLPSTPAVNGRVVDSTVVRRVPTWRWPFVQRVSRPMTTGERVGCTSEIVGAALLVGLAALFCRNYLVSIIADIENAGNYGTKTAQCLPGVDVGGNTTPDGSNTGRFTITSAGGPTMVDVTRHTGDTFDVDVVVLPSGDSATLRGVYGDHVWTYQPGCTVADVQGQVPAHVEGLNKIPHTLAQAAPVDTLEGQGILTINSGTQGSKPAANQLTTADVRSQLGPKGRAKGARRT